jgi:hypothetical protein
MHVHPFPSITLTHHIESGHRTIARGAHSTAQSCNGSRASGFRSSLLEFAPRMVSLSCWNARGQTLKSDKSAVHTRLARAGRPTRTWAREARGQTMHDTGHEAQAWACVVHPRWTHGCPPAPSTVRGGTRHRQRIQGIEPAQPTVYHARVRPPEKQRRVQYGKEICTQEQKRPVMARSGRKSGIIQYSRRRSNKSNTLDVDPI